MMSSVLLQAWPVPPHAALQCGELVLPRQEVREEKVAGALPNIWETLWGWGYLLPVAPGPPSRNLGA